MYRCEECGEEVGRVGDGDSHHQQLTIRGGLDVMSLSEDMAHSGNLTDLALGNPDILSDDHAIWTPRDLDAEAEREDYLRTFKLALTRLTARQAEILVAVERHGTHEQAAVALGLKKTTVTDAMEQIRKKLDKYTGQTDKSGLIGKEVL
jgi:DNA-directed RNA polymerase specialized sigma24 family protein